MLSPGKAIKQKKMNIILLQEKRTRKYIWFPGLFLLCICVACTPRNKHTIEAGFYYWKTTFRLTDYEKHLMAEVGAKNLYIRLFDVDWRAQDEEPRPVGLLQAAPAKDGQLHYIPVVYITQRCLNRLQPASLPEIAGRMAHLIGQLCDQKGIDPAEIQLDCDWTRNNAQLYFDLLRELRRQNFFRGKLLSCTIRMHQVKYKWESGIPPVDKGLLMVYNMGNLTRYGPHNSILDAKETKDYLANVGTYPLPLDIALPLFHWAVLFEEKKFKAIAYNLTPDNFTPALLDAKSPGLFRILADTLINGYALKQGQEIRFEGSDARALSAVAAYVGQRMPARTLSVSFFHLDSAAIQPYQSQSIIRILNDLK